SSDSNILTNNTANLNEFVGIYIETSNNVSMADNIAMENSISGFILYDSHNNTLLKNGAVLNNWTGIILYNATRNELKSNNASNNAYFGMFIISSNQNNLTNNSVDSNYYSGIIQYQSNNSIDNDFYNITEIIQGVRLYINEDITPSTQSIDNPSNASYSIVIENLGIIPDTFNFSISNPHKSSIAYLDKQNISLNPGQRANLTLYVGDVRPGGYAVSVKVVSEFDENISDTVETLTIVTGVEGQSSTTPLASIEGNRMLLNTLNEASPCQSPSSAFINSKCMNSIFDYSAVENSTIENSTIIKSLIFNSTVDNSTLSEVILENAWIINNYIIYGNITLRGITYSPSNFPISDILKGYDKRKSNLVGMTYKKLEIEAKNSGVFFNISASKDYFAASLEVQRSGIQPEGMPELRDNIGGYISIDASKNIALGAGNRYIRIYYNESQLNSIDENTLRMQYYNTISRTWEALDSQVNAAENYVWANTTHFSVFALAGAKATKVHDSGGGGEGGRGVVTSEPHDNIARYETEIRDVISNRPVVYNFIAPEHGIYELVVTGKESEKDIAIRIEALRGISRLTASLPAGIVYTNINIWAGTEQIKEVLIRFKVENSWISKYASGKVKMLKWDKSKWVQLETTEKNKDSTYTYYEAKTDSFSAFVITLIEDVVTPASTPAIEQAEIPKPIGRATQAVIPAKKAAGFEFEVILAIIALLVLFWQVRNRK
ncbi:MAG: PGF-pre-PGF domain-containing protein, partial [Euryarchaeota archaeon]|nr:PGF-pre-PGF domain-containing protein [Euryarchaeota archaeon]